MATRAKSHDSAPSEEQTCATMQHRRSTARTVAGGGRPPGEAAFGKRTMGRRIREQVADLGVTG